jgi:hypothetical protein
VATYASETWSDGAAGRWGHWSAHILCAAIVGVIALRVYPPSGLLTITVPLLLVSVVIGSWLLMRRHDRRLCEQCASSMPLNPGDQAARYKARFWVAHTGMERRILIPYVAVLLGSNFLPDTLLCRFVWAVVQLSMVYLILSHTSHRRLQPWCPWCKDGGGGSRHEDAPTPTPDDHRLLI